VKYLNGGELAEYVKERQAKEVRRLSGAKIQPKLVIISEGQNTVNDAYLKLKQKYGHDAGVEVELINTTNAIESKKAILKLNEDSNVHGIIVQLPLVDEKTTDDVVNLIEPAKDVDGLGKDADYDSATATAILWLLSGYNVELRGKKIVVVGQGKLVGAPLIKMLKSTGAEPDVLDENSQNFDEVVSNADVLITAAGHPGLIKASLLKTKAVVIDAGTASEGGQIRGDLADEVYDREDITVTPKRGGLGPLTVSALFDNVIRAVRAKVAP
jgi:methylenetetrahydrofolate dehydrogenase (NADP+)/methenyltetrahydrofolate cyclohydrolase